MRPGDDSATRAMRDRFVPIGDRACARGSVGIEIAAQEGRDDEAKATPHQGCAVTRR